MNFKKLQAMQLELDNSILSAKPQMTAEERFNKTLVALNVEVAEVANCAEHFKFWKDNKGKVDESKFGTWIKDSSNKEWYEYFDEHKNIVRVSRQQAHKLTLVEECSDCLHFILSLANQLEHKLDEPTIEKSDRNLEDTFLIIQCDISNLLWKEKLINKQRNLNRVLIRFMNYVNSLGITTQELEQAYYEKNEENYRRLREGY